MKRKISNILTITLTLLYSITVNGQDYCNGILSGGIYDYHTTMSNTERASSFINWFKQKQFSSYQQASSAGLSLGIPIDGILVGLGFSANESGFQEFKSEIEKYESKDSKFKQIMEEKVQTINKDVVAAWEHCVTQRGLHFWMEQSPDPNLFTIYSNYVPDGEVNNPYLISFKFTPAANIKIEDGAFLWSDGREKRVTFKGNRISQSFVRKNSNAVAINIVASRGDGLQKFIPAQLPIIDFTSSVTKIKIGESVTLSWNIKEASTASIDNGVGAINLSGQTTVTPNSTTTYKLTASNSSGGTLTKNLTVEVDQMLDRKFYLKIIEKNNGAWFQPKIDGALLTGNTGYFPVSAGSNSYWTFDIKNGANLISCDMFRWRDGNGDPGGRPQWKIKFQIVAMPMSNKDSDYSGETPITPIIEEEGTWYGDTFGLTLEINKSITSIDLLKANTKRYDEWKKAHKGLMELLNAK